MVRRLRTRKSLPFLDDMMRESGPMPTRIFWEDPYAKFIGEYYAGKPVGSPEYQRYWASFARTWSPGGSAPDIPGVGFRSPLHPDAPVGTMMPGGDQLGDVIGEITQMFPQMTPAQRHALAWRYIRRRYAPYGDDDY